MAAAQIGQQRIGMTDVVMAEASDGGARQARAGVKARMGQLVDDDEVVRADKGAEHADVGEIARAEHAGGACPFHRGESGFERSVKRMIAGHQPRRAGTDLRKPLDRGTRRRLDPRIGRQTEIVVAGKTETSFRPPRSTTGKVTLSVSLQRAAERTLLERVELADSETIKGTTSAFSGGGRGQNAKAGDMTAASAPVARHGDRPIFWRPYCQMKTATPALPVVATKGACITLADGPRC